MGIDVYLKWENQSAAEHQTQITGFSATAGDVGYLREAYHGGPYATSVLFPECFAGDEPEREYPAKILRERLPEAVKAAGERATALYGAGPEQVREYQQAYIDFVDLAEKMEAKTGKPCRVRVSY